MRLLVVEDHARLARMLVAALREDGHAVDLATDGESALDRALCHPYDAVVLDWMLPRLDGLGVLDELRQRNISTPVLLLTAKDDVSSRVAGLDAGADDYLAKPFDVEELHARLRALVRRSAGAPANRVTVADLQIDLGSKSVMRAGVALTLSAREFALLSCLALRAGRVVSREVLLGALYDEEGPAPASNVLEVYIGKLRRKVDAGGRPTLIKTRRGQGYLLKET
ncbi:MAG: response regulator transcription factor [Myxococcota bacterium]